MEESKDQFLSQILKLKEKRKKIIDSFRRELLDVKERDYLIEKIDSKIKLLRTRLRNKNGV
jgi:hypothetical protein